MYENVAANLAATYSYYVLFYLSYFGISSGTLFRIKLYVKSIQINLDNIVIFIAHYLLKY